MRVTSCSLENFASYKTLEFDFENQGLTLIQGSTGSGKSTLCDAVPWCLFGRTAKDGAVDEIISWNAEGLTTGTICVQTSQYRCLTITRVRYNKANDLYFQTHVDEPVQRGKDLNDTQRLINRLLGINSALYLSGAYFHEFSQTAQFFTTTAKNRRIICEQLVDLSLAKTLQTNFTEQRKVHEGIEKEYVQKIQSYGDRIQYLARHNDYLEKSDNFERDKKNTLSNISKEIMTAVHRIKSDSYFIDANKDLQQAKDTLGEAICSECGSRTNGKQLESLSKMTYELKNEMAENERQKNQLKRLHIDYEKEAASENVYAELIEKMEKETISATKTHLEYKSLLEATRLDIADIELLQDVVNDFRGVTIKNTIQGLEDQTNKLLSDHFDAEIRVLFSVEDADKLDVSIHKDGNVCSYTQLSKGQRQLLKLCFGVSVMRTVSNRHGVHFNALFFDEAFDGLSDAFKIKTYGLLKTLGLEYESIFVVDHSSELKALFENQYTVELINGNSVISG